MYRILIVEDDPGIAQGIGALISRWGMESRIAEDFQNVMGTFSEYDPQLVLLDISLPFFSGYYWCQAIRNVSKVPIVFISSAADNMNIVMAMNMGADDFISKPFDGNVLIAKIQAMLRRAYDFGGALPVIEHRGLILSTGEERATFEGGEIPLTKNEYRILLALLENRGRVVSREKLMELLWKTDCFVDENTLTVNVGRLRKKLSAAGFTDYITTKFGQGYLIS